MARSIDTVVDELEQVRSDIDYADEAIDYYKSNLDGLREERRQADTESAKRFIDENIEINRRNLDEYLEKRTDLRATARRLKAELDELRGGTL